MKTIQGKGLVGTIRQGVLVYLDRKNTDESDIYEKSDAQASWELERFDAALGTAKAEYERLYDKCEENFGADKANLFLAYSMILEDEVFADTVRSSIMTEGETAENAVWYVGSMIADSLQGGEDLYIAKRSEDIRQIRDKIISILKGEDSLRFTGDDVSFPEEPFVVAAEDFTPEDIMAIPRENLRGIVFEKGSVYSHAAILAKALCVPIIMQLREKIKPEWNGTDVVISGREGMLFVEPDEKEIEEVIENWRASVRARMNGLERTREEYGKIRVYANASSLADVEAMIEYGGEGIGLFRSELLYLRQDAPPDEETQFEFYKKILRLAGDREVTIRTFDFGADKQPKYLNVGREENPALGTRGIRAGFRFPELLKVQLRALFRAGAYGKLSIMYPMISTPEEVKKLKEIEKQVKEELMGEVLPIGKVPVGIMIETPSAALLSGELAQMVDFFSVGTNDLIQYTYARDRQTFDAEMAGNDMEAVLRLVEMASKSAGSAGIRIGVCGEMAADVAYTKRFLDMGIRELSVSPGEINAVYEYVYDILFPE